MKRNKEKEVLCKICRHEHVVTTLEKCGRVRSVDDNSRSAVPHTNNSYMFVAIASPLEALNVYNILSWLLNVL